MAMEVWAGEAECFGSVAFILSMIACKLGLMSILSLVLDKHRSTEEGQ